MNITTCVTIYDDELEIHDDHERWLEKFAPNSRSIVYCESSWYATCI